MESTAPIWISRTRLTLVLLVSYGLVIATQAQTFKVLHTFHSGKGPQIPTGALTLDKNGNLYGVTQGGTGRCWSNNQCGTVFKMTNTGKLVWVYSFPDNADGFSPTAGLLRDRRGNLFGVTSAGGKQTPACGGIQNPGCGLVFKLDRTGKTETVLHRFTGGADGQSPLSLLIEDSQAALYGTTLWGGLNYGVVFKMTQAGKEKVLYTFRAEGDGGNPYAGVVRDSKGNLYGSAGADAYEVDSTGTETVLYSFSGGSDGDDPSWEAPLVRDAAGTLYGTTQWGGNLWDICDGNAGCGVVFELTRNQDGSWTETTLYKFCASGQKNCPDGHFPLGGLIRDSAGNLYGTTYDGGSTACGQGEGCGVVFKVDSSGTETILHTFTGGPTARLQADDWSWMLQEISMEPARMAGTSIANPGTAVAAWSSKSRPRVNCR